MSKKQFVPENFEVPDKYETREFRLRMLSVDDVEKDYEAVMETQERFHSMGYSWPREGFTIEENLADLEQHQKEFVDREAFAYTVVSLDEKQVLGCVYINPTDEESTDARIRMWVRQREFEKGMDPKLFNEVRKWVAKEWPFENVIYPNRE
jgi:RimJ/RimL family protein N-acetyltransferase